MPKQIETTDKLDTKMLLKTLRAFKKGNFTVRLPEDLTGVDGEIAGTFNSIVEMNQMMEKDMSIYFSLQRKVNTA